MHKSRIKVLLVEDNPLDVFLVQNVLQNIHHGIFEMVHVEYLRDALTQLQQSNFDIVVLDLGLPDCNGLETFNRIHALFDHIPFLLLSHRVDEKVAIEAIKSGAQDYLVKGEVAFDILPQVIRYSIERKKSQEAIKIADKRFQTVFDRVPIGIALINSITSVFYDINPTYAQILGYTKHELLQLTRLEIAHTDDKQDYLDKVEQLAGNEVTSLKSTWRINRSDGSFVWVDTSMVTFDMQTQEDPCHLCMIVDITERKQMMEDLQKMTEHSNTVREEEGKRIAREIHDDLGANLTVLKMDLDWLSKKINDPILVERIQMLHKLTGAAIDTTREISKKLRPNVLDNLGLMGAIEWLVRDFEKQTKIECLLTINVDDSNYLDDKSQTQIFRIIQEVLTNVKRHAMATLVKIRIEEINGNLQIKIYDNGIGITSKQIHNSVSYGIRGIFERVEQLNGKFEVNGIPTQGSCVILSIPYKI